MHPRPGRPRNAAIDRAVLEATIGLLSERGLHGVSVEDIATHAHVGKDTLYRRWPTKRALVTAALDHLMTGTLAESDRAPGRDGLVSYLLELDRLITRTPFGPVLASTLGEATHDAELGAWVASFWASRRVEVARLLTPEQAASRDSSLELEFVLGTLVSRWFIERRPVTRPFLERLADSALAKRCPDQARDHRSDVAGTRPDVSATDPDRPPDRGLVSADPTCPPATRQARASGICGPGRSDGGTRA